MESLQELVSMYKNTCPVHSKLSFYSVNCKTCNIIPHDCENKKGSQFPKLDVDALESHCSDLCRHCAKCHMMQKLLAPVPPRVKRKEVRKIKKETLLHEQALISDLQEFEDDTQDTHECETSFYQPFFEEEVITDSFMAMGWPQDVYFGIEPESNLIEFPEEEFKDCNDLEIFEKFIGAHEQKSETSFTQRPQTRQFRRLTKLLEYNKLYYSVYAGDLKKRNHFWEQGMR